MAKKVDIFTNAYIFTVGAQSIACAQSIAHSHIGDSICKKKLNFWKIIFTGDKKGNSAAHSWTKNHIFSFKSGKWSCSKKVVFIFCKNFAGRFFLASANFRRLKNRILKGLYNHYLQGADDKLGQFLDQDIEATANHRNVLRHSLESCPSLVSPNVNKPSFVTKICRQGTKLVQMS